MNWSPDQLAAYARGEAHAVEMLTAGQNIDRTPPKPKLKKGSLRPEKWQRCPVCHAPAVNPSTGECEMAVCETRRPRSNEPFDHNGDIAIW